MKAHLQYLKYVLTHKYYVFVEARKLGLGFWQALLHDLSKFSRSEWGPYVNYHTRGKRDPETTAKYLAAWNHHIHNNPHHWEFWVLVRDGKTLRMPEKFLLEMVADWRGVSRTLKQNDDSGVKWYTRMRDKINLHGATRLRVEFLLGYGVTA